MLDLKSNTLLSITKMLQQSENTCSLIKVHALKKLPIKSCHADMVTMVSELVFLFKNKNVIVSRDVEAASAHAEIMQLTNRCVANY